MGKFVLLLVDTETDFIIVQKGACLNCTEGKTGTEILKAWEIPAKTVTLCSKRGYVTQFHRIKCECGNPQHIPLSEK